MSSAVLIHCVGLYADILGVRGHIAVFTEAFVRKMRIQMMIIPVLVYRQGTGEQQWHILSQL